MTYPRIQYTDWKERRNYWRRAFPYEFRIILDENANSLCSVHRNDGLDAREQEWHVWCRQFVGNPAIKRARWKVTGTYAIGFKRSEDALMFKMKFV